MPSDADQMAQLKPMRHCLDACTCAHHRGHLTSPGLDAAAGKASALPWSSIGDDQQAEMSWHAEQLTHASSLNAITFIASVMPHH